MSYNIELTAEEIAKRKNWLRRFDASEKRRVELPAQLWDYYFVGSETGSQIYQAFSDDELLDIIRNSAHGRNAPRRQSLMRIYGLYIRTRFGGYDTAYTLAGFTLKPKIKNRNRNRHRNYGKKQNPNQGAEE
jgi:hypothetical protein